MHYQQIEIFDENTYAYAFIPNNMSRVVFGINEKISLFPF
jgi:hypothetical protein